MSDAEGGILALLEQWTAQYIERDIDRYMALFSTDDRVIYIGPELIERCEGLAAIRHQAERDWQLTSYMHFVWNWYAVSVVGSVGWLAAEGICDLKLGEKVMKDNVRLGAVVRAEAGSWRFVQLHLSVALGPSEPPQA